MPENSGQDFRRMPAKERTIAEITPQDIRVRIIGTILDKQDDRIVLDDGTGKIDVSFEKPVDSEVNKTVRVLGKVISIEGGMELQGEVIQDMGGFDMELWRKVRKKEQA